MRTLLRSFVLILMLCAARSLMAEEAVTFTKKPTAIKNGAGAKISFAMSSFTDVTIYIEDDKGIVIRHLASGLLGKNPPKQFQANSLSQTIIWDGKADYGPCPPVRASAPIISAPRGEVTASDSKSKLG